MTSVANLISTIEHLFCQRPHFIAKIILTIKRRKVCFVDKRRSSLIENLSVNPKLGAFFIKDATNTNIDDESQRTQ